MNNNTEITLAVYGHDTSLTAQLIDAIQQNYETKSTLDALSDLNTTGNSAVCAMIDKQTTILRENYGYILGLIKAQLDTLPDEVSVCYKIHGVPLNMYIKLIVDREVRERRKKSKNAQNFTCCTEYWSRYRRLSEIICGYGYNLSFIKERFESFFPDGIHSFVRGFASGYNHAFSTICRESNVEFTPTNPVEQDVFKNLPYFLQSNADTYSLDGLYLFPYHGGIGPKDMPMGINIQKINTEVYKILHSRPKSNFVDQVFNFSF